MFAHHVDAPQAHDADELRWDERALGTVRQHLAKAYEAAHSPRDDAYGAMTMRGPQRIARSTRIRVRPAADQPRKTQSGSRSTSASRSAAEPVTW